MVGGKSVSEFNPSLRNIGGNTWEASIQMPVVGTVTVKGCGWEQAKVRLWLIQEAMSKTYEKPCKPIENWTAYEWVSTLQKMSELTTPTPPSTSPASKPQPA